MKKYMYAIFMFVIFLFFVPTVNAAFGDLRYEIVGLDISESKITFKGWAFIHYTNNFREIKDTNGTTIKSGGDQKILMQAIDASGKIIDTKIVNGSDSQNYNFYCELYYGANYNDRCSEEHYKNLTINRCELLKNQNYENQCYYEDIYFEITFDTSSWSGDLSKVSFKIGASNADFESKLNSGKVADSFNYEDDVYTALSNVSIASAAVSTGSDFIEIDTFSVSNQVEFFAVSGIIYKGFEDGGFWFSSGYCAYGNYFTGSNIYNLYIGTGTDNGRSLSPANDYCKDFLGSDCKQSYYYYLKIDKEASDEKNGNCYFSKPCSSDNCQVVRARGSHARPTGDFSITVKDDKKCEPQSPASGNLECNSNKTFKSTCEELTVKTGFGSANVEIEQTGSIASVLTPGSIYEGGGFNFGILYTNTIKWEYVDGEPSNSNLKDAVAHEMKNKLKDYDSYFKGIRVTNIKFGNDIIDENFLVKSCKTSDPIDDYYKKELTVSCVFYLPKSDTKLNGDVEYTAGNEGLGISNKYYVPFGKYGEYKITAKIQGMDRINQDAAKRDSNEDGVAWTGDWSDTFENCIIDVYPLFYKKLDPDSESKTEYNFIYRPISIFDPFPNRNAGINWFDWIAIEKNKERLEETYKNLDSDYKNDNLQYVVVMNNQTINKIKNYNKGTDYLNWNSINWDSVKKRYYSDYIKNNSDIIDVVKVGGD